MRLAALAAVAALAAAPVGSRAQGGGEAAPAPKADEAQPTTPKAGTASKPPPPAARDLAKALLTEDQWNKVLDSYASSLSGQVSQSLLSSGEKVPEDLRPTLRAELGKALPYQQTIQAQAEALSKELTPDELKRTAQFYSSPLGRKVLEKLPEAQASVAQQLQGRLATAVPEIVNRVAPKAMSGSPHGGSSGGPVQGRRPPSGSTTQ